MLASSTPKKSEQPDRFQKSLLLYVLLILATMWLIVAVGMQAVPEVVVMAKSITAYGNFTWARNQELIEQLIVSTGMIWLLTSVIFFGMWLLHRSYRKLKGKTWLTSIENQKRKRFFPALLSYLKLSCAYFLIIFLFLVLQYPLQFIIFYP